MDHIFNTLFISKLCFILKMTFIVNEGTKLLVVLPWSQMAVINVIWILPSVRSTTPPTVPSSSKKCVTICTEDLWKVKKNEKTLFHIFLPQYRFFLYLLDSCALLGLICIVQKYCYWPLGWIHTFIDNFLPLTRNSAM